MRYWLAYKVLVVELASIVLKQLATATLITKDILLFPCSLQRKADVVITEFFMTNGWRGTVQTGQEFVNSETGWTDTNAVSACLQVLVVELRVDRSRTQGYNNINYKKYSVYCCFWFLYDERHAKIFVPYIHRIKQGASFETGQTAWKRASWFRNWPLVANWA